MVKHSYGSRKWSLPGGSLEERENVIEAAEREFIEETGYRPLGMELVGIFTLQKSKGIVILFETGSVEKVKEPDYQEIEKVSFLKVRKVLESEEVYPAQSKLVYWSMLVPRPIFHPLVTPRPAKLQIW